MKKYKIVVNLNRITVPYLDDFEKARKYHAKHGVDVVFDFRKTDVRGYKSYFNIELNLWMIEGAVKLVDIDKDARANMFVFDMAEWSTKEGSKYPLKKETPNGGCMLIDGKPFICIGTYIVDHNNGQTWIQIAHEIMHSYVQNAYMEGINVTDVMDTYRLNSEPDNLESNFTLQWRLLAPYFDNRNK